jgi:hypothetical protein
VPQIAKDKGYRSFKEKSSLSAMSLNDKKLLIVIFSGLLALMTIIPRSFPTGLLFLNEKSPD